MVLTVVLLAVTAGSGSAQSTMVAAQDRARSPEVTIVGARPPGARPDGRLEYHVASAGTSLSVDGRMDEAAWAAAEVIPLAWEVRPANNGPAPVATECRITQDADHLYLGCTAHDPDPDAIRAYIVDRDRINGHDRIVLTLDPFNDQRRSFQFGISALGVQFDAVMAQQGTNGNNGQQGDGSDPSWDAIWSSAGAITSEGFTVEAAIPFRSLRFPNEASDRGWGVYLTRWWPRSSNVEVRSATWDRDNSCLLCQANVVTGIEGGAPGVNVQATPTLTGSRTDSREFPEGPLVPGAASRALGIDGQWGITSDVTLNLTANPDFSQVEADAAQLDVNNRFALFFPEKRPFFLEGADFFGTPIQAVFTRSIKDPTGGAKVTGKVGSNAVGVLMARDAQNDLIIPGSQFSSAASLDQKVTTGIARFRRDLGGTSTLGALFVSREASGYHNRVGGLDAFYRPAPAVTVQAQFLRSDTRYPAQVSMPFDQPTSAFAGNAGTLRARWNTSNWHLSGDVRQIDRGFRADAGFVTQAGVRGGSANLTRRWWGGSDRWFTQLRLEGGTWANRDFDGNQINGGVWLGLGYDGPGQTSIGIWPNLFMKEHFGGTTFEGINQLWFDVRTSPAGSWSVGLNANVGDAVDFSNARLGSEVRMAPTLDVRLGRNVEAGLQYTILRMSHEGERVFTAQLSQLRTVYNFSARSFIRGIVQYRHTSRDPVQYNDEVDRTSNALFAQLLYAYKVNPQTVFFLGYGQDGSGRTDTESLRTPMTLQNRTFFVKLGYAWRP